MAILGEPFYKFCVLQTKNQKNIATGFLQNFMYYGGSQDSHYSKVINKITKICVRYLLF